jgi:hypothetical protein
MTSSGINFYNLLIGKIIDCSNEDDAIGKDRLTMLTGISNLLVKGNGLK